jgi:uncharacterized protein YjbI with pentapeptide repeats
MDSLIKLLKMGVVEWNKFRRTAMAGEDLSLEGMDFSQIADQPDFSGIDFSRTDFGGAIFPEGTLLKGANLEGCDFQNNWLRQVNFSRANLRNANFCGAQLHRAVFTNADLREANFSFATIADAVPIEQLPNGLFKYKIVGADLSGAMIDGLLLAGAQITTKVGNMPKTVTSPEQFFEYAEAAGMNIKGINGRPRCEGGWKGVFTEYRPR